MSQQLVVVGAIVEILGIIPYLRDTLLGTTKPNRVTWLLWSLAPLIAAGAAFSQGVGWSNLPVVVAGATPFLVFLASFAGESAAWRLGPGDYVCGAFSIAAFALWLIADRGDLSVLLAIATDALATLPTLKKCWADPQTETPSAFMATLFGAFTGLFAMREWSIVESGFLVYLVITFALLSAILYFRGLHKGSTALSGHLTTGQSTSGRQSSWLNVCRTRNCISIPDSAMKSPSHCGMSYKNYQKIKFSP